MTSKADIIAERDKMSRVLRKYITHVGECEGTRFFDQINDGSRSSEVFDDEEIEILKNHGANYS